MELWGKLMVWREDEGWVVLASGESEEARVRVLGLWRGEFGEGCWADTDRGVGLGDGVGWGWWGRGVMGLFEEKQLGCITAVECEVVGEEALSVLEKRDGGW